MRSLIAIIALAPLTFSGCNSTKPEPASTNQQAALTGQLPYNPLAWKVITSSVNYRNSTMSTLYGNDTAVAYARSHADHTYPAGSVIALVTWSQREDPHWFGAKIPSTPLSVEFVTIPPSLGLPAAYERYQGSPITRMTTIDTEIIAQRTQYLLSQRAAVMP